MDALVNIIYKLLFRITAVNNDKVKETFVNQAIGVIPGNVDYNIQIMYPEPSDFTEAIAIIPIAVIPLTSWDTTAVIYGINAQANTAGIRTNGTISQGYKFQYFVLYR